MASTSPLKGLSTTTEPMRGPRAFSQSSWMRRSMVSTRLRPGSGGMSSSGRLARYFSRTSTIWKRLPSFPRSRRSYCFSTPLLPSTLPKA